MFRLLCFFVFLACVQQGFSQSCVGRCDNSADSSYTCQCNSLCDEYGDCCVDYIETCVPLLKMSNLWTKYISNTYYAGVILFILIISDSVKLQDNSSSDPLSISMSGIAADCHKDNPNVPFGSCSGRCTENYDPSNACHCTPECVRFNNCCLDFQDACTNSEGSCVGRCETPLDSSQACQCNSACTNYGDCCPDYSSACSSTPTTTAPPVSSCKSRSVKNTDIHQISLQLFDLDVNRASSDDLIVNKQASTSSSSTQDNSPENFFTYVSDSLLSRPTYSLLIDLLDNYEMFQGINEDVNAEEIIEQDAFLDAFMQTTVGAALHDFFYSNGLLNCPDEATFKDYLKKMWFEFYSRQNGAQDTSGFEHVFAGEIKTSYVSGFHNWVQFYRQELLGRVEYYGYTGTQQPSLYGMHFTWDYYMKELGSAVIGASPEYELAIFTLCHVMKPDAVCSILMRDDNGAEVSRSVQTWAWSKTSPGSGLKYVASSYFFV